jgi:fibronectin-binding autotransporter adhesin
MNKPNTTKLSRNFAAVSASLVLAAGMTNASAATRTWDGGGSPDVNWTTAANWVDDIAPVQGDDLVFSGTTSLTNNNDITVNTWFNSINFTAGAGGFVLQGNQIRIGNNNGNKGVTNSSANIQEVELETKNDRQVNYDTTGASMIFHRGPWDQRFSKSGPNDLICLQKINQLNGQVTGLTGGRLIMNGQTNGVAGLGLQIDTGGTAISAGPANQIGDSDTRADVTMSGGLLQLQNTNAAGSPHFEQIPMLRSTNALAVVENGAAWGPVELRVGGGTGARAGAFDGTLRDGSGGGALSVTLNNFSGAVNWRLGGINSYTGDTIITNGFSSGFTRMIVNGLNSGGGNYLVGGSNGLAVLAGAGTIVAGSVNVNFNGVIAPGGVLNGTTLYARQGGGASGSGGVNTGTFAESTATLTITNNVNLNTAASALDIHLGGTNAGSYDKLVVAGSGIFSNNSGNLQLTVDIGFIPTAGDKFTIVDVPGTSAANNVGTFASLNGAVANLSQGATITLGGSIFKISYRAEGSTFDAGVGNGNNIMLEALPDTSSKLTWRGDVDGDWDVVGKLNWRNTNNVAVTFTNLDKVTFNDTGVETNINLTTDLTPATLLIDATKNYSFGGLGKLTGAMVITKTNTGTLTITTANDNVGAAIIDRGTIQVGAGGIDGALTCPITVNSNGVLAINRSDDQVLGPVSGKGVLSHIGSGKLSVTNDLSTFTGTVSNTTGTFQFGDGATAGANAGKIAGTVNVGTGTMLAHSYFGSGDVTAANSMSGNGSATFDFPNGTGARTIAFGTAVTNSGFAGTTTVKPYTRLNVATAASTPAGPIIVEGGVGAAAGSYYTHAGATFTNLNSLTIAGEGPGSTASGNVDTPRGKGALRLGNVWSGSITLSANATIGGDGTGAVIGNISDGGNNYTLEYLGGVVQVGPVAGVNSYGETRINEDYSGNFLAATLTTVRLLNANAFGSGPVSMKGRARLELNGFNVSIANLNDVTLSTVNGTNFAPVVANGSGSTPATLTLGSDNITGPVFIGTFINGGVQPLGLTKVGSGTFMVSGDSTNTGTISVQAGTLALAAASGTYPDAVTPVTGSGSFSNAAAFAVATGATLDVSGRSDSTLTLNAGQTLKHGGAGTGPITVTGNVNIGNGTLQFAINRTGFAKDTLAASGAVTYSGTLAVTNIGAVLQAGDSFQLFPGAQAGFAAFNLPTTDVVNNVQYTWNNTVTSDGKITVQTVSPLVNTTPTNIVALVSGGNLNLSWPSDHTGWSLQTQTNALGVGLSTNWVTVPGSTATNEVSIPINAANPAVFFRLQYP